MDPVLAEMYGTNGGDLEKQAEAELAEALNAGGEMDLSDMDEEQLEALASEVLNDVGGEDQGEDQGDDQEKVAEADFLGRVMAHAYAQEQEKIANSTAEMSADAYDRAGTSFGRTRRLAAFAKDRAGKAGARTLELLKGGKEGAIGEMKGKRAGNSLLGLRQMTGEALKSHGTRGAALGAAGLGVYGIHRHGKKSGHKKEASAIDQLAYARAQEILEEQGGNDPRELLAEVVEARALEMLNSEE